MLVGACDLQPEHLNNGESGREGAITRQALVSGTWSLEGKNPEELVKGRREIVVNKVNWGDLSERRRCVR